MSHRYILEQAKQELLSSLEQRGISPAVLQALATVPRERFVPEALQLRAYEDTSLPIGHGQTISQPYTVAYMTDLLDVHPGQRVLEIGTGSGYQTAILCTLGAHVWTIERFSDLAEQARQTLHALGLYPTVIVGDGWEGYPPAAPYDRIIVTAAAPEIPMSLARQLKVGGKMVVPVGQKDQHMYRIIRINENEFDVYSSAQRFRFVPFVRTQPPDNNHVHAAS
ncbi:MAG: protein-L-isoaspartate(D-aspartate) O-methyltransferase [Bacteroidota bacterium]|nr:protein-L-isoaspartate(D-aspartate) O-methyltransferase [Candidatus Kapabacteria bacterium]MCS7302282.1 protein-L-isoaspartate(D-aspartate) O-methyltransferase [Candidatus Kapabacteria bacterium]MDW8074428.1 protein-L-isoaspartate(D-aspartate) O-methyltransferase [Bacteroidota bacterium]MDW8271096.1 protein-L-isoaspartate(D-aspartate) O-methyltransferase [Bacteroidota bacterium]